MNRPEVQNKGAGAANHQPPRPAKRGTSHKGISKTIRQNKRIEAEIRQEAEHERDHPFARKNCIRCISRATRQMVEATQ